MKAVSLLAEVEWDGHMDADGVWWVAMVIGMLLFWGLVILGIALLVRDLAQSRRERSATEGEDPLAILDRRLALGEISADEYRERQAILREGPQRSP